MNSASKLNLSRENYLKIQLQCYVLEGKTNVTLILRLKVSLKQLEIELSLPRVPCEADGEATNNLDGILLAKPSEYPRGSQSYLSN